MKKILLALFLMTAVRAVAATTVLLEDAKLELAKGKGSIVLKVGSVVEVAGIEGDSINVIFRNLQGRLPANKTDYLGGSGTAVPEKSKAEAPAPAAKPAAAKTAEPAPAAPAPIAARAPASIQGKMVQKARDNEAKHKENLVEPTDNVTAGGKK